MLPSELYPVSMRTTGHGISASIGKLGAFIGVFLFPVLQTSLGLRGTLLLTAGVAVSGFALTFVLPEPGRAQPGRHRHQHARHGRPAAAGGRSGISALRNSHPLEHPLNRPTLRPWSRVGQALEQSRQRFRCPPGAPHCLPDGLERPA